MPLNEEIARRITDHIGQAWSIRDGRVVPNVENIPLAGSAVQIDGTVLYSDLADSTELAKWNQQATARICKAFLSASSLIIKNEGGEVRSFDGDRVMGVFLGANKNTDAVRCALKISWMFLNQLKPKFEAG